MICPACGHENAAGEGFCAECGSELVEAAAQSAPAAAAPTAATLPPVQLELAGPAAQATYALRGTEALVGRRDATQGIYPEIDFDGNDIVLDRGEPVHAVSRRHGRIFWDGTTLMFEDLGSTNGSTIDGRPVLPREPQPLADGSVIVLGRTCRITVHIG